MTTIAIHLNLLYLVCPTMSTFVLAVLFVPSFYTLSSCFMFHSVLVADPTVIMLIKFWDTAVQSITALKTRTKDEDEPGLNCSAVILVMQIPIPSINASKMAPTAADLTAAEGPPKNNQSTRYAGNFSGAVLKYIDEGGIS